MSPESNNIDSVYERRLGKKLALIEELRAELGTEGIECPGVLVVGAQSAGKSSVLERLTDIAFPRAENTCTRVPTIVQLQTDANAKNPSARVSRHADFKKAICCSSMKAIQDAIISISNEITSEACPIKDEPIHIQYTRKAGPVMTLIDLPGITHVDVNNEAFDIHGVTAAMVKKYVANDNMVVLVVIPANDDFGNSEALRIAQEFDPDGVRTIGVVSKCDLVPEKSDIVHKIRMSRPSDVKLALGFIAVRNKGPGEDEVNVESLEEGLFLSHALLSQLSKEQRGYVALTKRIVDLQSERVEKFLPEAYKRVKEKTKQLESEMKTLGEAPKNSNDQRGFLTKLLCHTSETITSLIRGENVPKPSMNIAARSHEIGKKFGEKVRARLPDFHGTEYGNRLSELLKETVGYSLPNFMNDSIFRNQVHDALFSCVFSSATEELISRMQELVVSVYREVLVGMNLQGQFPKLVDGVCEVVERRLEKGSDRAKDITDAILEAEKAQIYTQSAVYMENVLKVKTHISSLVQVTEEGLTIDSRDIEIGGMKIRRSFLNQFATAVMKKEEADVFGLQVSIECYVDVVLKRLLDVMPMVARNVLVYETLREFHHDVQGAFCEEEGLGRLLAEPCRISERRAGIAGRVERMRAALKKLQEAE